MADAKITQLAELTTVDAGDLLPIVDDPSGSPVTKKITALNLFGAGIKIVVKSVDESVISSTTYQSDDELFLAIGANEKWIIDFFY